MDVPLEPPPSSHPFSAESNSFHYVWGRSGSEEMTNAVGVYNIQTKDWTLQPTTGPSPPEVWNGGCTIIANNLYCFGGSAGVKWFNGLRKLDLNNYEWTEISTKQDQTKLPICKDGCGFVPVDETTLVCFGGNGKGPVQPKSTFSVDTNKARYTNELHLFNIEKRVWSSPRVKGERPPPCSDFTFTKVDQERAVLFGGNQPTAGNDTHVVNDLYLFKLKSIEVTKVKPGHPWPVGRAWHGASCLNYDDDHPQLLVFGGVGDGEEILNDVWLLDVASGRWTELTPPESLKPRWGHSITSTRLRPGLTEVLLFGGKLTYWGNPVAETTVLKFEHSQSVTGPPTEKWTLVSVTHNKVIDSSQQLMEESKIRRGSHNKMMEEMKVRQASFSLKRSENQKSTVVPDKEMNGSDCRNRDNAVVTTPPRYPLHQTSAHPQVTFYDEPQEREIPSTGGHVDFNNGVEITAPPHVATSESTLGVKVQPSFASCDVFEMPEGIESASPSYLISCKDPADLNGEIIVDMEHHVDVSTKVEADDLVFLQADSSPGEGGVYRYWEVPEGRSEFNPGECKGKFITRLRALSATFLKIGLRVKDRLKRSNLYTVLVYRSPPHTAGDRLAVIFVSLSGRLYKQFLEKLNEEMIPTQYPEVSTKRADRTIVCSVHFDQLSATLTVKEPQGWTVIPDIKKILQSEASRPETGKFKPSDLHNYPPRIHCTLCPEGNAPSVTTCCMTLTGLKPEVKVNIPLKAPKSKPVRDTTKLQTAAEQLRRTVCSVSHTQLGPTVESIVSLAEKMTEALRSSSLSDLTANTSSIKAEVRTLLKVSRKVAKECTRQTIKEAIDDSLSKLETLSHQLYQVAKVKFKHCHDESEQTAALEDLVERGAGLLTTVDCLLRDMRTLNAVASDGEAVQRSKESPTLEGTRQRTKRRSQQRADSLEAEWVVNCNEIQLTEKELGRGGWGVVKVAKFRGSDVAAKTLFEDLHSDYYTQLFIREMNMAARVRHPNLVQFIGASLEGGMIILTELMHTSVRKVSEQGPISREHTVSIAVQVCQALNYLHLMQPNPLIHRDISSANVLLNPLPSNKWQAKVTDFGSVNILYAINTVVPGNPTYSAPEAKANDPSLQSPKMDIFSVGVLLIEMKTGKFPVKIECLLPTISDRGLSDLISRCIHHERDKRPTAEELLSELERLQ